MFIGFKHELGVSTSYILLNIVMVRGNLFTLRQYYPFTRSFKKQADQKLKTIRYVFKIRQGKDYGRSEPPLPIAKVWLKSET